MNFSAWAIRNPVPSILLFIMLFVMGLMSFNRLDVQSFPDMDMPAIMVSAGLDGAAAAQLETEVARKIEDRLTGLSDLDSVTTTVTDGSVSMMVVFQVGKDTQLALDEVSNAVDRVRSELPAGMNAPSVSKLEMASTVLVTYVVSSDKLDEVELSWLIDNDIERALMAVDGVGEVSRVGGVNRQIDVRLDSDLMAGLGLTPADINNRLNDVQRDLSGGKARIGGTSQSIRVEAAAETIEDLRATPIPLPRGGWVRLEELGEVIDGYSDRSSLAYLNGEPVIAVQVKRSSGFSDIEVTEGVREALAAYASESPSIKLDEAYNTIRSTEENYKASMHMLYEGALIAMVVVFLFLRDWRATFIAATALPLSIIPTFIVMDMIGYSLNAITLLALSLVVGILVDDAIVEVENIERHLQKGGNAYDASIEAADEIGLAVVATTLSLVAVFLPTAFMGGIPGIIFKQFGITASVAVLFSLLVARLITPMMAAYILKSTTHTEKPDGFIMRNYMALVRLLLRRRWIPVAGLAAFFAATFYLLGFMSTSFFPASDTSQTRITISTAPGTMIEATDRVARATADAVKDVEHVTSVFISTGAATSGAAGGPGGGSVSDSVNIASLLVNLTPIDDRDVTQEEIEAEIRKAVAHIPGARLEVGNGGNGTTLQITLAGENAQTLEAAAEALENDIRTNIMGIGNVTSSSAVQTPAIVITPDPVKAAELGVTTRAISDAIRVATSGAYDSATSKLNLPERQVPIRIYLDEDSRTSIERISMIPVMGEVTIGAIADISMGSAPSKISRLDRLRNVSISIELNGRNLSDVMKDVTALESFRNLPDGVTNVQQGDLKRQAELFSSFATAMAIGIFCVYAVLVLLFHSFLQPVTILMALPMSLGGALLPLVISGTSFSMPAVIGLILLMGIVSKNSILLVEYAIAERRKGVPRGEAILDACHKRARPIIMTTMAMAGGMVPAAFSLVAGDPSFRQPMGVVVIGGLMTSTFLSLLVIPVIYTFMDDLGNLFKRLAGAKA